MAWLIQIMNSIAYRNYPQASHLFNWHLQSKQNLMKEILFGSDQTSKNHLYRIIKLREEC